MRNLLSCFSTLAAACLLFAGCATTSTTTQGPASVRLGYSPMTDPPLSAKGRMLIHPFSDHHPNGPQDIPGTTDALVIAPDQSLAKAVSDGFAEASRFAGYEVVVAAEPPVAFQPDVVVEGDIQTCQISVQSFAGMKVTTHSLGLQVRMTKPGSPAPAWQGSITGDAGNFVSRNLAARIAAYETMLKDSLNTAMWQWVQTLDPAATAEIQKRGQQRLASAATAGTRP